MFYRQFIPDKAIPERCNIKNSAGSTISAATNAPTLIRGDNQFWGVFFCVQNRLEAFTTIQLNEGNRATSINDSDGTHYPDYDSQDAAFFLSECDSTPS